MTISLSIPRRTLSARAPASDTDIREERMRPLGTILIAAYLPVMACLAIFTRPVELVRISRYPPFRDSSQRGAGRRTHPSCPCQSSVRSSTAQSFSHHPSHCSIRSSSWSQLRLHVVYRMHRRVVSSWKTGERSSPLVDGRQQPW